MATVVRLQFELLGKKDQRGDCGCGAFAGAEKQRSRVSAGAKKQSSR